MSSSQNYFKELKGQTTNWESLRPDTRVFSLDATAHHRVDDEGDVHGGREHV
jgi:hypothetical protein